MPKNATVRFDYCDYPSISNNELRGAIGLMEDGITDYIPDADVKVITKGYSFGSGIIKVSSKKDFDLEDLQDSIEFSSECGYDWKVKDSYDIEVESSEPAFAPTKAELESALGQRIMDYNVENGEVSFSLRPAKYGWPSDDDFYADFVLDGDGILCWIPDIPTETLMADGKITNMDQLVDAIENEFGNWEPYQEEEEEEEPSEYCENCDEAITGDNELTGDGYCESCKPEDEDEDEDE
jgi:hypothetical protein